MNIKKVQSSLADSSTAYQFVLSKIINPTFYKVDTSIELFQNYNPNGLYGNANIIDLGNTGTPTYSFLNFLNKNTYGFQYKNNTMQYFMFNHENMPWYRVYKKPYTSLTYWLSNKSENYINVTHAQQLKKGLYMAFNYRFINADGIYTRQVTKHTNFNCQTQYTTPNERYSILASFIYNKLNWQENGGSVNDSIFELQLINKNVAPIKLSNASNNLKNESILILQTLHFGKKYKIVINDSTEQKHYASTFTVNYLFSSENNYYKYADKNFDSSNYMSLNQYIYSDSVVNKYATHSISNEFYVANSAHHYLGDNIFIAKKLLYKIYLKHEYDRLLQSIDVYKNNNVYSGAQLFYKERSKITDALQAAASIRYGIAGYCKNDLQIIGNIQIPVVKLKSKIILNSELSRYTPDYFLQKFYFNNTLLWQNSFDKTQMFSSSIQYEFKPLQLNVGLYNTIYKNAILLNSDLIPQKLSSVNINTIAILHKFNFKKFYLNNIVNFNITNLTNKHIPYFTWNANYFYKNYLFKKAMLLQTGINLNYNTAYLPLGYNPLYASFYTQNSIAIFNLPSFNIYANCKIKSVRLSLQFQNILQGVNGHGNYNLAWYPQADRVFKFGVNWLFND